MQTPLKKPAPYEGTHGPIGLSRDLILLYDQRQSGKGLGSRVTTSCVFYNFGLPVTGFHHLSLVGLILSQAERKVNENLMKAEQKDLIPDKLSRLIKKQPSMEN